MEFKQIREFIQIQKTAQLVGQDVIIPDNVDAFLQSQDMQTIILKLICETEPTSDDNKLELIATLTEADIKDSAALIQGIAKLMYTSPLYLDHATRQPDFSEDNDTDQGQKIVVDEEKGEILQQNQELNAEEEKSPKQKNIDEKQANNIFPTTDEASAPQSLKPKLVKHEFDAAKFDEQVKETIEEKPKSSIPEQIKIAQEPPVLKPIVSSPKANQVKNQFSSPQVPSQEKLFIQKLEKQLKMKIDLNNFDFEQIQYKQQQNQEVDVDGIQKMYQDQEEEIQKLYQQSSELIQQNSNLQQQLQNQTQQLQHFSATNNINFENVDQMLSDLQKKLIIGSPTTQTSANKDLIQQLKLSQRAGRTKELEFNEQIAQFKQQILNLQHEKMRQEQNITDMKRVIEGLQMRVNANKRVSNDQFGLEKMKKEAQVLMQKAERMGYK